MHTYIHYLNTYTHTYIQRVKVKDYSTLNTVTNYPNRKKPIKKIEIVYQETADLQHALSCLLQIAVTRVAP